jgi:hypothetical protein
LSRTGHRPQTVKQLVPNSAPHDPDPSAAAVAFAHPSCPHRQLWDPSVMWRHFDEPAAPLSCSTQSQLPWPGARAARRRRLQVAEKLIRVARHAAPRARQRQHELMLISRAAAVRTAPLDVAAVVRRSTNPDPECIADLHTQLSGGGDTPVHHPDVPTAQPDTTVDRARTTLSTQLTVPC